MSVEGNRRRQQSVNENKVALQKQFIEADVEAYLDTKVVSAYMNMSLSWFANKAVYGGGIPYRKLPNKRLYKKGDVLEWIENNSKVKKGENE